jgi:hypothetical protein
VPHHPGCCGVVEEAVAGTDVALDGWVRFWFWWERWKRGVVWVWDVRVGRALSCAG